MEFHRLHTSRNICSLCMPIVAVLFSWGMALIVGCSKETPAPSTAATAPKPKLASSALPKFVDATAAVGIHFAHVNGGSGRSYYVETYGSGAAFVDYDSDGDEDLYLVNGAVLPGFLERCVPQNALYRNRGNGKFEEITAQAGVGDADLFVANDKTPNFLFRNEGGAGTVPYASTAVPVNTRGRRGFCTATRATKRLPT